MLTVITIGIVANVSYRRNWTCLSNETIRVTIRVAVNIGIESQQTTTFISSTVTIIINSITNFCCSRINRSVAIITIGIVRDRTYWCTRT